MMKGKKHIFLIFSLFVLMFSFSGCSGLRHVRPVSFKMESFSPHGFYNIGMKIALGIENPSVQFEICDVEACLVHPDGQVARMTAEPFKVMKKCTKEYPVSLDITLAKGFYLGRLLALVRNPEELFLCTVDVEARVKFKGGASKKLKFQDIPVQKIFQMTI